MDSFSEDHSAENPFYGTEICRSQQQELIQQLLKKYQNEKPSEELKKKLWEELQMAKHAGLVTIPFKITERRDPYHVFPPYIEVILDTKV